MPELRRLSSRCRAWWRGISVRPVRREWPDPFDPLMEERIRPLAGRAVTTTSFRLFNLLRRVMTNGASLLLSL